MRQFSAMVVYVYLFPRHPQQQAPQLGMEFMGFLRAAVQKHAFGAVQTKAYIHGARLLRNRLAARQSEDCLYLNVRTASPLVLGQLGSQHNPVASVDGGGFLSENDENDAPGRAWEVDDDDATSVADDADPVKQPQHVHGDDYNDKLLPVIVYIHGGDYHDGAGGSRPFYAANALPVKGRVVLVTFNYRLGLIGHFTHPELSKEAEAEGRPAVSGNYSLMDQVKERQLCGYLEPIPCHFSIISFSVVSCVLSV